MYGRDSAMAVSVGSTTCPRPIPSLKDPQANGSAEGLTADLAQSVRSCLADHEGQRSARARSNLVLKVAKVPTKLEVCRSETIQKQTLPVYHGRLTLLIGRRETCKLAVYRSRQIRSKHKREDKESRYTCCVGVIGDRNMSIAREHLQSRASIHEGIPSMCFSSYCQSAPDRGGLTSGQWLSECQ